MTRMSKAKKVRTKMEREGHRNPSESHYRNVGLETRMTKNKTRYTRKGRNSLGATRPMDSDLSSLPAPSLHAIRFFIRKNPPHTQW